MKTMTTDTAIQADRAGRHPPLPGKGMSLRLKINLIFSILTLLIFSVLISVELAATRASVREEMEASGRIASQLLGRVGDYYGGDDLSGLVGFLRATGRVRANDIRLYDRQGTLL